MDNNLGVSDWSCGLQARVYRWRVARANWFTITVLRAIIRYLNIYILSEGTRYEEGSRKASEPSCLSNWKSVSFRELTWSAFAENDWKVMPGATSAFARKFFVWPPSKHPLENATKQNGSNMQLNQTLLFFPICWFHFRKGQRITFSFFRLAFNEF